jgi:hypothetical protein
VLLAQSSKGIDGLGKAKFGMSQSELQTEYPADCQQIICNSKTAIFAGAIAGNLHTFFTEGKLDRIWVDGQPLARFQQLDFLDKNRMLINMFDSELYILVRLYGNPTLIYRGHTATNVVDGMEDTFMWSFPDKSAITLVLTTQTPDRIVHVGLLVTAPMAMDALLVRLQP